MQMLQGFRLYRDSLQLKEEAKRGEGGHLECNKVNTYTRLPNKTDQLIHNSLFVFYAVYVHSSGWLGS